MTELIPMDDIPQQVKYAIAFRYAFAPQFKKSGEVKSFAISVEEFDTFIIVAGFTDYTEIPKKDEKAEWSHFRITSNTIRAALNKAAQTGQHGEPPYRVDFVKGELKVRLLMDIVRVTHTMMMEKMKSLAKSKAKDFSGMHQYLAEHMETFPPALQATIAVQDIRFRDAVSGITSTMNRYIDGVEEAYSEATRHIKIAELPAPKEEEEAA